MSTGTGDPYRDSQTRHLSDEEQRRGMAAIERLEGLTSPPTSRRYRRRRHPR